MRKANVLRCGLAVVALAWAAFAHAGLALVPYPQHVEEGKGSFVLDPKVGIEAPADARSKEIAAFLHDAVEAQAGIDLHMAGKGRRIALRLDPALAARKPIAWRSRRAASRSARPPTRACSGACRRCASCSRRMLPGRPR